MRNFKKTILSSVLFCVMCFTGSHAANLPDVTIYANDGAISGITHSSQLNTSSGLYTYGASLDAFSGTTHVYVAVVIQRKVGGTWTNVPGSFISESLQYDFISAGNKFYVEKGYWYRTVATYIATKDGVQQKIVDNSDQTWYD